MKRAQGFVSTLEAPTVTQSWNLSFRFRFRFIAQSLDMQLLVKLNCFESPYTLFTEGLSKVYFHVNSNYYVIWF